MILHDAAPLGMAAVAEVVDSNVKLLLVKATDLMLTQGWR